MQQNYVYRASPFATQRCWAQTASNDVPLLGPRGCICCFDKPHTWRIHCNGALLSYAIDTVVLPYTILGSSHAFKNKRVLSLLLYLGDPTVHTLDQRPWDCQLDGGALRIHGSDDWNFNDGLDADRVDQVGDVLVDISPHPGTLVLFDSGVVSHEVMTTHRPRSAIVGWFGRKTWVLPGK